MLDLIDLPLLGAVMALAVVAFVFWRDSRTPSPLQIELCITEVKRLRDELQFNRFVRNATETELLTLVAEIEAVRRKYNYWGLIDGY